MRETNTLWVAPLRPTHEFVIPFPSFSFFIQNISFLFGLLVPLEKQADDQDQCPDNPPAPILLIESGSCQREATGPDSEFRIVDGQRASSRKRKQQTTRSGLQPGRVGMR